MNQANIMAQMRKMQQEMTKAQEELANTVVTGTASGDAVKVEMTCDHRVKAVAIAREAIDPEDAETLEDLIVVACNDALKKADEATQSRMGQVTGGLNIPGLSSVPNSGSIAGPVQALINEFSKLPTIGPKTAARLVFYLLNRPRNEAQSLAEAILSVKDRVQLCSNCFSITEDDPCPICSDEQRDGTMICVVAEAKDIFALERTGAYKGRYHVLGGLISPMDGIGPAQLRVKELVDRMGRENPGEIILATNPNAEGEATALYLSRLLTPLTSSVTRLAYGLPIGGDLDYADEVTLAKAIEGRRTL